MRGLLQAVLYEPYRGGRAGASAMSQSSAACYPLAEDTAGLHLSINLDFGDQTRADFFIVL